MLIPIAKFGIRILSWSRSQMPISVHRDERVWQRSDGLGAHFKQGSKKDGIDEVWYRGIGKPRNWDSKDGYFGWNDFVRPSHSDPFGTLLLNMVYANRKRGKYIRLACEMMDMIGIRHPLKFFFSMLEFRVRIPSRTATLTKENEEEFYRTFEEYIKVWERVWESRLPYFYAIFGNEISTLI